MTEPNVFILSGCWRMHTGAVVHPALFFAMKRGGYAETIGGRTRLTDQGRGLVSSLERAYEKAGVPLPPPNGDPRTLKL